MARPGNGPPEPDLYQLLGVARQATPAEITQAWRRRARAEHPDARPLDAGAPSRFRALADAYELLSDPGRRAAYDQVPQAPRPAPRAPRRAPGTAVRVIVLSPSGPPSLPSPLPAMARGPLLWAGPVRVEPPSAPPARDATWDQNDQRPRQMRIAQVAARYLDDVREWPW